MATRFLLSCVRQRELSPQGLEGLETRIRQLAAADPPDNQTDQELARLRAKLVATEAERNQIAANLARAKTDDQFQAIEVEFNQLAEQTKSLQAQIAAAERQLNKPNDADSGVDVAMGVIRQLTELARDGTDLGKVWKVFDLLNARLFLKFHPVREKKRTLNKIQGGVVTFGNAPPPVEIYQGPTSRSQIKGPSASDADGPGVSHLASPPESCVISGEEDKSLGNVSRGERIRTSDLLNPIAVGPCKRSVNTLETPHFRVVGKVTHSAPNRARNTAWQHSWQQWPGELPGLFMRGPLALALRSSATILSRAFRNDARTHAEKI